MRRNILWMVRYFKGGLTYDKCMDMPLPELFDIGEHVVEMTAQEKAEIERSSRGR